MSIDAVAESAPGSRVSCMLPWTSLHVTTSGDVLPCCIASVHETFGSTRTETLAAIWNGQPMRQLRLRMLAGQPSRTCENCYEQERSGFESLRQVSNVQFSHHRDVVQETGQDGSLPRLNLRFLDIRFNNICNFTCRTCGPTFSTAWYRHAVDGDVPRGILRPKASPAELLGELRPLLDTVEHIYFAGGEPTLAEEHYRLLEALIALGRTSVQLSYSTNFSVLRFRHWDLLKLWQRFGRVAVGASLDAGGSRGEYLRAGLRWNTIVENRRRQRAECAHVAFTVASTLSNMNALHLPDFHEELADTGFIEPGQIFLNILQIPEHFRITTLPATVKVQVRARYERHSEYLTSRGAPRKAVESYASALRFMESQDTTSALPAFRRVILEQDAARGENFAATFPELQTLLHPDVGPPTAGS